MTQKRIMTALFVVVLLDAVGFGVILPVLPALLTEITGESVARAALYGGWLAALYAGAQFVAAPVIGNLSDCFGRRPVLLAALLTFGLDYLIMGMAESLLLLFVGRLIAGITGATFGVANSVIADVIPADERAQWFGLVGAAFGGGFILGPVIGGFLGELGTRAPFYATAGLAFANALFVCWVMPETLARENRRAFDWKRANPLGALKQLRQFPVVYGLAVAVFFFMLGHWVLPATWSYYTIERFSWSEREIGFSLAFVGVLMMFVQAYLIRVVSQIWSPGRMVFIALVSATVSLVGYALAPAAWLVYLFMLVGAVQGFFSPAVNTIATTRVGADAQGELQGSLGSLSSLAAMLSPPLMTAVFEHYSASANGVAEAIYFPGAPYLLAAGLTMIAGGFVWHALRQR